MQQRTGMAQKKPNPYNSDTVEAFKSLPRSVAKNTAQSFANIGSGIGKGIMDSFLGTDYLQQDTHEKSPHNNESKPGNFQKTVEFKRLYDFQSEQEKRTIKELLSKIHEEIKALKNANTALAQEVKDVENLTLSSAAEKPGIYHIRFLELVLSFIQTLRMKISESGSWLEAMNSKKAKRGSAFAVRSKKSGTQYSMSEEHKITRNTQ
jgi:hypothetical protein